MVVQTVEIAGHRFVLLPEEDFRELQRKAAQSEGPRPQSARARFSQVTPFVVCGESASEMLIRERR